MARGALPGYAAPRSWTPLALTLGLHLLLALASVTGVHAPAPETALRVSTFVLVQALPPPKPDLPRPLPIPRTRRPDAISMRGPVVAVPTTDSSPEPEPVAGQPDPAPAPALRGDLLASARAMAGRADRELRQGSSPITAEPERKWERFAEAVAAARTDDGARTVTLDSFTSPDGVTIYRRTRGNRTSCYRSGSVGGVVTGFGNADLHGASIMTCPAGVRWTRH